MDKPIANFVLMLIALIFFLSSFLIKEYPLQLAGLFSAVFAGMGAGFLAQYS